MTPAAWRNAAGDFHVPVKPHAKSVTQQILFGDTHRIECPRDRREKRDLHRAPDSGRPRLVRLARRLTIGLLGASDPVTFVVVSAALLLVSLAVFLAPARRTMAWTC